MCVQVHFGVAVPSNGESVNVSFTSAVTQTNGHTGTQHIECVNMDRDSSVGIATRYGLDGPVIKSLLGELAEIFRTRPGAHPASYTLGTGSFPGVKRPGRGVDHPPTFCDKVKERV